LRFALLFDLRHPHRASAAQRAISGSLLGPGIILRGRSIMRDWCALMALRRAEGA